jgi:putative spermidine/putrescine transport system substrate-binding protein
LQKKGNFVPVAGQSASLAQGTTPMTVLWDYNGLAARDSLKGNPKIEVIVPKTGVVAGVYVQAISAFAPHPAAAKLWMEYLYSDEGQLMWLNGYCHPIRFNDLAAKNLIPADMMAKLPPAEGYAKALFPTLEQQSAAKKLIGENWEKVVGVIPK